MFSIGDAVSYPMHGVGIIEAIESQLTLGEMVSYYVLRFEDGRLTTMIPVNQAERLGMRKLLPVNNCTEAFEYISSAIPVGFSSDWNERRNSISSMLHSGDLKQLIDVIISLNTRNGYRGISTGEHRIINAATKTLVSELHTVLKLDEEKIVSAINARLYALRKNMQSCIGSTKNRD